MKQIQINKLKGSLFVQREKMVETLLLYAHCIFS
jgi:hypothetical protein